MAYKLATLDGQQPAPIICRVSSLPTGARRGLGPDGSQPRYVEFPETGRTPRGESLVQFPVSH